MTKFILIQSLLFFTSILFSKTVLTGTIYDKTTEKPLYEANIYLEDEKEIGTSSNQEGEYYLSISSVPAKIVINYVGYQPESRLIYKSGKQKLNIYLKPQNIELEEIIATAEKSKIDFIINKGHTDKVTDIAVSPNGKYIASASMDQTIKLWTKEGVLIRNFAGHTSYVQSIAFSPNGEYILSSSYDGTIKGWSLDGEHVITTFIGDTATKIEFIDDEHFYAVDYHKLRKFSFNDKSIKLIDALKLDKAGYKTIDPKQLVEKGMSIDLSKLGSNLDSYGYDYRFLPGKVLSKINFSLSQDKRAIIYNDNENNLYFKFLGERIKWEKVIDCRIIDYDISPDLKNIALHTVTGDYKDKILILDTENGAITAETYPKAQPAKLKYINNGQLLTTHNNGKSLIWDNNLNKLKILKIHSTPILITRFNKDTIYSLSGKGCLKQWMVKGQINNEFNIYHSSGKEAFFIKNSDEFLLKKENNIFKITTVKATAAKEYNISSMRNSKYVNSKFTKAKLDVVVEDSFKVDINFDLFSYRTQLDFKKSYLAMYLDTGAVNQGPYIPSFLEKKARGYKKNVSVYEAVSKRGFHIPFWSNKAHPVRRQTYSYKIQSYSLADNLMNTNKIKIIDDDESFFIIDSMKEEEYLETNYSLFSYFDFGSTGNYFISTLKPNVFFISNINNSDSIFVKNINRIEQNGIFSKNITALKISSDDKFIGSGYEDGAIDIWNINGEHLKSFTEHNEQITCFTFSKSNEFLISGSNDDTIRLWSLEKGLIHTFKGHRDNITSVDISHDENYIISSSDDGTVKIWNINTGKSLTYLFLDNNTPVVYDEYDNFFCYEEGLKYINYVEGKNIITSKELIEAFYKKDLIIHFFKEKI